MVNLTRAYWDDLLLIHLEAVFAELRPEEIKPQLKNTHTNKTKDCVFPEPPLLLLLLLILLLPRRRRRRRRPSVSTAERLDGGAQSHCLGAQMHTQSRLLRRLNSVNPSAVPNLRTQAAPLFSPLSRIFTLSHGTSSQHKFHWKLSSPSPAHSPLPPLLTPPPSRMRWDPVFFLE